MRRAKIVATIGPASSSPEQLRALADAGMDVARLNFSHGNHNEHGEAIRRLRALSEEIERPIGILQDLQGPKLRTGQLAGPDPVALEPGETLVLTTEPVLGTAERCSVDYTFLPDDVRPGDPILLDDGRIELEVTGVGETEVRTRVRVGGLLGAHKGLNLPGVKLSAPALTNKDLEDLSFGIEQGVDFIAMSFVRHEDNLRELRSAVALRSAGDPGPLVVAKLERREAVERLEAIVTASDGVMVARGDLGVEVSAERVPSLQKRIIATANRHQRLVITATQMLESMIHSPRPTRAEASDVANAVFDGSDALMLSGETAVGEYPVEAVRTMERIILDAEAHALEWGYEPLETQAPSGDDAVAATHAARALAHDRDARAIAVFTRSGRTAMLMAAARPRVPILAFTPELRTYRNLALAWGVTPHLTEMATSVEEMINHVEDAMLESGEWVEGQQIVLVASLPIGAMGPANFNYLHTVRKKDR